MDELLGGLLRGIRPEAVRCYPPIVGPVRDVAGCFGVDPDDVVLTPGSDAALRLVVRDYAQRSGDRGRLLLQAPNYGAWEETAALTGLRVEQVTAPLADAGTQAARLLAAARRSSRALLAVSVPNGPVGGTMSAADLDRLAEVAADRGHLLVIDGCYQAFDGPLAAMVGRAGGPVLVVQSLSKSHGLAGARVSGLFGSPALLRRLAPGPLEHAVAGPSLALASATLQHPLRFQAIWRDVREARDAAAARLRRRGREALPSGGNFLTLPVGTAVSAGRVVSRLSAAGYRVKDLSGLPSTDGCVRFTVGPGLVDAFLDVLEQCLDPVTAAEV